MMRALCVFACATGLACAAEQPVLVGQGQGQSYDWGTDQVFVKVTAGQTGGRLTLVEDHLKPGFVLPRHHHEKMTEVFTVLAGEVEFTCGDRKLVARAGSTLTIPPGVRHAVSCPHGATLLTTFAPGGFDVYLAACAALTPAQAKDASSMKQLSEKFDIHDD